MTTPKRDLEKLRRAYRKIRPQINKRLSEFRSNFQNSEDDVFSEMSFCLLTANANALRCDEAIKLLKKNGLLLKGSPEKLKPYLKGRVRFHNKKAEFIVRARGIFKRGKLIKVKGIIDPKDIIATRDWLVENIKGYGYKESSHFLRNIGFGQNIAILDRHILKNLKGYGVIGKIPDSVGSRKVYIEIEDKMRKFSKEAGIPLDALDLLFWSFQTGFIFK